jgi:hypothetical protein
MINANLFFVFFVLLFGFIGAMRGWVREIIVTASLIFGIFVLNWLKAFLSGIVPPGSGSEMLRFLVSAAPFLIFAFFGYLGPAVVRGRFAPSTRGRVEEGILSFMVGCFNGYLISSTLAYLAWNAGILGSTPYPPNVTPPWFSPPEGGWESFFFIKYSAVLVFSGPFLIIFLILIFLFLIVVII